MRKFQVIIDLDVADEKLTENSIVSRWKKGTEFIPGVTVSGASAVPVVVPIPAQGVARSLADVAGISNRLLNICRSAGILTVEELAFNITDFNRFRGTGPGTHKQAIAVCVAHGGEFNPDKLEPTLRSYAIELRERQAVAQYQ